MHKKGIYVLIAFATGLAGCPADSAKKGDEEVRQAWTALQSAVKAKDPDKLWELLDKDSQSDAERQAKAAQETYSKLADKDKADYEEKLGLTSKELSDMTGKWYVKSKVFYKKHYEIPDSKLDKVAVTGETAKLNFIEPDDDDMKMSLVRDKGRWRFNMSIPKAPEK